MRSDRNEMTQQRNTSPTPRLGAAALTVVLAGLLTACGTTPGERALSGAGIGAATGAAAGVLTGGSTAAGALLGGAAGAAAGGLTDEEDVDLGKPAWK